MDGAKAGSYLGMVRVCHYTGESTNLGHPSTKRKINVTSVVDL